MSTKSKSERIQKWAVVSIYNEGDGALPLVHVIDVFCCKEMAKKFAKKVAEDDLKIYRYEVGDKSIKFNEVWEKVDNKGSDEFLDFGFDPVDSTICLRIRVCWYTEATT